MRRLIESSHLELCCLQSLLLSPVAVKELNCFRPIILHSISISCWIGIIWIHYMWQLWPYLVITAFSLLCFRHPLERRTYLAFHSRWINWYMWLTISETITKSCLYNFDPLKPHCYTVKLRFTGLYIIFLISAQKHRLWVLVRTASLRRF